MKQSGAEMERRVLVLAPLGRDAELTCVALREAGIACATCSDVDELATEIEAGVAATIVAEEAFSTRRVDALLPVLRAQPGWSDLPVIFLTSGSGSAIESRTTGEALECLGNVQLLERPTRVGTLLSVVRAALRARERQYQIRDRMLQQEEVERALRRSEAQLKFALEAAEFGTWDFDLASGRIVCSPRHHRIFGYGTAPDWTYTRLIEHIHADDQAHVRESFQAALASGKPWIFECRIIRADGQERWIWAEGNVLENGDGADGGQRHMIGLLQDITERKLTEEVLERRTEDLARSNTELQDFAYIASHDLKEPLRGICNYSRFVLEDEAGRLSREGADRLHTIMRLSKRMYALLDSLLDYSRVGRTELAIAEVPLRDVVAEVVDSMRPWLEERGARVILDGSLPVIRCDPVRAGQVFSNLIANGVKYNESPTKRIEVGCLPGPDGVDVIYVRDNGIGIPERHQPVVFKMFRRLHPRERYEGGTGAGLALVKRIIERHRGSIWLESTPGAGSTFFFTFAPLTIQRLRLVERPAKLRADAVTASGSRPDGAA